MQMFMGYIFVTSCNIWDWKPALSLCVLRKYVLTIKFSHYTSWVSETVSIIQHQCNEVCLGMSVLYIFIWLVLKFTSCKNKPLLVQLLSVIDPPAGGNKQ